MRVFGNVFLTLCMYVFLFQSLYALDYYHRAGDAPQDGEIYKNKENGLFINARSLPFAYRSRITKNTEAFERVEMSTVVADRKISDTGIVSYSNPAYAQTAETLLHDRESGKYFVLESIPETERQKFTKDERFVLVEVAQQGVDSLVEEKMMDELDSVLGIDTQDSVIAQHEGLSESYAEYLEGKLSAQQSIVEYIDDEMNKYTKRGDLGGVGEWQRWKSLFLSGSLAEDSVTDKKFKRKIGKVNKKIEKLFASLRKDVDSKVTKLVKSGRVAEAQVLQVWVERGHTSGAADSASGGSLPMPRTKSLTLNDAEALIHGYSQLDGRKWKHLGGIEIEVDSRSGGKTSFKVKKGEVYLMVPHPDDRWENGLSWKGDGAVHNYLGSDADRRALIWRLGTTASWNMMIHVTSNEDAIHFAINLGATPPRSSGRIRVKIFKVLE